MSKDFYDQINKYGIKPKKSLGQNFLTDQNIVNKIITTVPDIKQKHILEVGPGVGCLSLPVLNQKPKNFSCIEFDERCVKFWQEQIIPQFDNITLYHHDALTFDESKLLINNEKLTLLANLPYNIASVLLIKWLGKIHLFEEMTLMFQKEVAERICASPNTKAYGILSVLSQYLCDCRIAFNISQNCFYPPPKVDSSIVILKPKADSLTRSHLFSELKSLVKTLFNMRRKTIFNNLKKLTDQPLEVLQKTNIDKTLRPENLSIDDFVALTNAIKHI